MAAKTLWSYELKFYSRQDDHGTVYDVAVVKVVAENIVEAEKRARQALGEDASKKRPFVLPAAVIELKPGEWA